MFRNPSVEWLLAAGVWVVFCLMAPPAEADIVINEILIDPDGSDAGREFVELLNPGDTPVSLARLRFEFANGAEELDWRLRWEGAESEQLAPGARYLIVDRNWQAGDSPDAEVTLALQNGPDSVRLVRNGAVVDLLGYGSLTDPSRFETAPVALTTGRSLARRPDGVDTGDNSADFVSAEPTPGAANFQDWSIAAVSWSADPPSLPAAGGSVRIVTRLLNDGLFEIPPTEIQLRVGVAWFPGRLDRCEPGTEREIFWDLIVAESGSLPVELRVPAPTVPGDLQLHWGRLQVGAGDLVLSEVLAAPTDGQQEWIELEAVGEGVPLGQYAIRDEDGPWRSLPQMTLDAGQLLVVAQDSTALVQWMMENRIAAGVDAWCGHPGAILLRSLPGSWPSLNNESASNREFADRVYLGGPSGEVLDHVQWGGDSASALPVPEAGTSLERVSIQAASARIANWAPSTAQSGATPGCQNSRSRPPGSAGGLRLEPRVLDPGRGAPAIHVLYDRVPDDAAVRLRIFDLWGNRVRDLASDDLGGGPRHWTWDGRDDSSQAVPPGGYIFHLTLTGSDGRVLEKQRALGAVQTPGQR